MYLQWKGKFQMEINNIYEQKGGLRWDAIVWFLR